MNLLRSAPIFPVLLSGLVLASTAGAAVDPALLDLVPPDTKVLYGIEVQQALSSPFGQFMLSRMPSNRAGLLQFAAATGFDPQRDLREVLLASSTGSGNLNSGIVLARGTFQVDRLTMFAGMIRAKNTNYSGVPLITPPDPKSPTIAILDSSTLAIGSEAAVKSVIDRRASQLTFSGPLAQKALTSSLNGDVWFATVTPLAGLVPANQVSATFVQTVIESSGGVRFDSGGATLSGEAVTHSATEATGLVAVLKFLTGMVKGPQAAVLQNIQFIANGPVTSITLTVAEQDLEHAFPAPAQGRAAR